MRENYWIVSVMLVLLLLLVGCATVFRPDGTVESRPADGVVESLQVAIIEASMAVARSRDNDERLLLSERLRRLREELQAWQALVDSVR